MNVSWRDVVSVLAAILGAVVLLLWNSQSSAISDLKSQQQTNVAEAGRQLSTVKSELQQQVSSLQTQTATTNGDVQALKARVDSVEKGNDRIEKNTQRLLEILGERRK